MNKYVKEFFLRGLMFSGFGPVIIGIIYVVLSKTANDFSLTETDVLSGIISTYLIAFVQAGASVFNQIEHWSTPKSLFFHFGSLYIVYSLAYILNSWIPFVPKVLLIFTLVFIAVYFTVWITVYLIVRHTSKKFNSVLEI